MRRIVLSSIFIFYALVLAAKLPSVTLRDIDGKSVNVATLADSGKPVILSFFATWCKPCIRELKAIDEVYDEWQEETGVEIYVISTDQGQDVQKVKPMVDGFGWRYHVLLDPNGELKRAMNVQNVPHMFVIGKKGNTVYNHMGYTDGGENEIRLKLEN
ncbi:MAG: TlpA family protein disulfide reductase [Paludibacteraceae bacterium]|nr:TlpA family protein disulfide reductase [Paludibacteraceae bacterium]